MTTREIFTKLTERPIYMICATVFLSVSIFSITSCTASCWESMTKSDSERAKYRAMQSESFWRSGK